MTDWRTALRDADARDDNDWLSPEKAESIRRAMLAAASARVPEPARWSWTRPMFVAATLVAMIAVAIVVGRRVDVPVPAETTTTVPGQPNPNAAAAEASVPNRQLQFLTPGGTRIIWVFNSEFDVKATMR